MNAERPKDEIQQKHAEAFTLSREIGTSRSAFYRKMNGKSEFTLREIKGI